MPRGLLSHNPSMDKTPENQLDSYLVILYKIVFVHML